MEIGRQSTLKAQDLHSATRFARGGAGWALLKPSHRSS